MKLETYERAQKIIEELQPLYEAHNKIKERIQDRRTFSLHESYFDFEFVNNINAQIDAYIDRKKDKLEREFELL